MDFRTFAIYCKVVGAACAVGGVFSASGCIRVVLNNGVDGSSGGGGSPPVADAGSNQTTTAGNLITLDATASRDPDGAALSFSWAQTAGTAATLTGSNSAQPTFIAPDVTAKEALKFTVTVSDGSDSATDTTTVDVAPDPTLVGPYEGLGLPSVLNLTDQTLGTTTITSSRTSPYSRRTLTINGTVTPASGQAIFIRCDELVLAGSAIIDVKDANGTAGSTVGGGGGAGAFGGGGGAGVGMTGFGTAAGGRGGGTGGAAAVGNQSGGTGGAAGSASTAYAGSFSYGNGGNGGAGSTSGGAGGAVGAGSDGMGGGGGGGGAIVGSTSAGGGGGGGGGGLIVVACNRVTGTASLLAQGGNGGNGVAGARGQSIGAGAGGGGGGVIWAAFDSYSNNFTTTNVNPGAAGSTGTAGTAATSGTKTIYDLDLNAQSFGGTW
ncbi:MAG: hypothetical protein AB7P04_08920 [Bacteriovoracia bacterium]